MGYERCEFPTDRILLTNEYDEWDHVRYLINEDLKLCDMKNVDRNPITFISYYEDAVKEKLIKAGFEKGVIENNESLERILYVLDREASVRWSHHRFDLYPPYGLPPGSFDISADKHIFWVKPDIEAALQSLKSLSTIKALLTKKDGTIDRRAAKVYLRTMELIINLSRSGDISKLATAEANKRGHSIETRDLKKEIIGKAVNNVFQALPNIPKTLGSVWNKFDFINGSKTFGNKGEYRIKTGKDANGKDVVIISKDDRISALYARRTLQNYINKYK